MTTEGDVGVGGRLFLRRRTTWMGLAVVLLTASHLGGVWRGTPSSFLTTMTTTTKTTTASTTITQQQTESNHPDFWAPIQDMDSLFHHRGDATVDDNDKETSKNDSSTPSKADNVSKHDPPKATQSSANEQDTTTTTTTKEQTDIAPPPPSPVQATPVTFLQNLTFPPTPVLDLTNLTAKAHGCTKDTRIPHLLKVTAQWSTASFPDKISMDHLIEVVQAGVNFGSLRQQTQEESSATTPRIALCRLRREGNYAHFPHMMQQFTRCFSFWQIFKTYQPYLYMYTQVHAEKSKSGFNQGMLQILRQVFGVKIVYNFKVVDDTTLVVKPLYDTGMEESVRQGIVFQKPAHAQLFRQRVQEHYHIPTAGCQYNKTTPVIHILNRHEASHRSIVNADKLRHYLQQLTTHTVQIVNFENKTFWEQVAFMSQTDLLLSPHGAQLTSLNFLPAPCGGLLEIFPPGYYVPHFFGPLAVTSGLQHGFVYLGQDVQKEWYKGNLLDRQERWRARRADVCVPLATSLAWMSEMVERWKTCCQEQLTLVQPVG